jgi:hypothetical protein
LCAFFLVVVEDAFLAGLRVFDVVFVWTKRGELRGKRGREAATFVVVSLWDRFLGFIFLRME